jgi:hypothetical protein
MHVQITHNEDVSADAALYDRIEGELRQHLGRFERELTTVQVNLMDMNAGREGGSDKRVSLEGRPTSHQPVAVKGEGGTFEDAARVAAKTLERRLDSVLGKRSDVKGGETIRKSGSL